MKTRKLELAEPCLNWFSIALWLREYVATSLGECQTTKNAWSKIPFGLYSGKFCRHLWTRPILQPVCVALLLLHMHNLLLPSSHWSEIHRPGLSLVKLRGWVTWLRAMAQSWNTCTGKPTKLQVPSTCFFNNLVVLEMRMRVHACMQLNLSTLPLIRQALCLNKMPLV